jgi:hypothetical protein
LEDSTSGSGGLSDNTECKKSIIYILINLNPITTITCEKVIKEIPTSGSSPLLVLGSDMNFHFAKTCKNNTPRIELINELVCAYLAQCWSLKVPDFNLVQIDRDIIEAFRGETGSVLTPYKLDRIVF